MPSTRKRSTWRLYESRGSRTVSGRMTGLIRWDTLLKPVGLCPTGSHSLRMDGLHALADAVEDSSASATGQAMEPSELSYLSFK